MSKAYEMISESLTEIIEGLEKNDGKNLSITKGILQGLEEAVKDAQGLEVEGLKKTSIYHKQKSSKKFTEHKKIDFRKYMNQGERLFKNTDVINEYISGSRRERF